MSKGPHLNLYHLGVFLLLAIAIIVTSPDMLPNAAIWLVGAAEHLFRLWALMPTHVLFAAAVIAFFYYAHRPRPVYLVDYACFRPITNYRYPKATFLEHARLTPSLHDSTVDFIARVIKRSGIGEETCYPPGLRYIPPSFTLDEAHAETNLVVFSAIDDLLAKTGISLDAINVLITNCSVFCPVPSIADVVVNRYKLRGSIRVFNLSGMGCSASVTAVGLARNLLRVMPPGSYALMASTETSGPVNYYMGNTPSMQLVNILFRMGGTAALLSNSKSKARFQLAHVVRTLTAADDRAYRCVFTEEDDDGRLGATLSKDLMDVAADALKINITTVAPLVLPLAELLKVLLFSVAKKILRRRKIRAYIPDFTLAFKHFCIHVGGPAVISSVQRGLNLSDEQVEPSRMTLHRFGNQSSASVWYELAYIEAKGRMHKGDRVWMVGLGAGYTCNTAVWVCIRPPSEGDAGPWAGCIHRYPIDVSKEG
ncbi:unnamed protein product [Alopecurus aequalis]